MASEQWFCQIEGKQYGPFSGEQLKTLVSQGKLLPTHLLRQGPQGQWVQATRAKGLFPEAPTTTPQSKPSGLLVAKPLDDPPSAAAPQVPAQPQSPTVPQAGLVLDAIPVAEAAPQVVEVAEVPPNAAPVQAVPGVPVVNTGEPANPFAIQTESPTARAIGGRARGGRTAYAPRGGPPGEKGLEQAELVCMIVGTACLALLGFSVLLPWLEISIMGMSGSVDGVDATEGKVILAISLLAAVGVGASIADKGRVTMFGAAGGCAWGAVVATWFLVVIARFFMAMSDAKAEVKKIPDADARRMAEKMIEDAIGFGAGWYLGVILALVAIGALATPFLRSPRGGAFCRQQAVLFSAVGAGLVIGLLWGALGDDLGGPSSGPGKSPFSYSAPAQQPFRAVCRTADPPSTGIFSDHCGPQLCREPSSPGFIDMHVTRQGNLPDVLLPVNTETTDGVPMVL